MESLTFRQRLAHRLEGHLLLRTLVLDRAFFYAFTAGLLVVVALAVGVPKMWRTTPENFSRATIKVSLIDLIQAWSLSRSARKAEQSGDYEHALISWRAALVNNLGDESLHRGLLTHLRDVPEARSDQVILTLFSGGWLLALTQTNLTDLELMLDVLEKYRLPSLALDVLDASAYANDPTVAPVRARCLLTAGRDQEFLALWRTYSGVWEADSRQSLYHTAWRAGWEEGVGGIEAMQDLRKATERDGNEGLTAARLLILAGGRRGTPDDLELALQRLEQGKAASVSQHATYWRFLASLGRFDEAKEKARAYASTPRLASDAAEYAAALAVLDLRDEAVEFLEENLGRFEGNPVVWEVYLSILIDARRWNDVRRAAATLQVQSASFETVRILALFAQYRAEVGEDRDYSAGYYADKLAEARIIDNSTALRVAGSLVRDGRTSQALTILRNKRDAMQNSPAYWRSVFAAALKEKSIPDLQTATTELLRLMPRSPIALSNRAAMLIAIGEEPAEALEITFRLVTQHPEILAFQINHAFALLLNDRLDEAWNQLQRIDPERLDRQTASAYHLAMTEALYARGQHASAWDEAQKVQPSYILPPQARRLEELRQVLHRLARSDSGRI